MYGIELNDKYIVGGESCSFGNLNRSPVTLTLRKKKICHRKVIKNKGKGSERTVWSFYKTLVGSKLLFVHSLYSILPMQLVPTVQEMQSMSTNITTLLKNSDTNNSFSVLYMFIFCGCVCVSTIYP